MGFYLRALLLGLLHIHCGGARVLTEVPPGPVYRVVGHPLHVPCNASGFANAERRKDFYFLMHIESKNDINVIRTDDPNFAYGKFSGRVHSEEITLEVLAANAVLFTMTNLMASDEGEYECVVVNDEGKYDGDYSAKIMVKVIDNTLTVSSLAPTSVSLDEGDPLTLMCQASSNTVQHTHLSVTWYLHTDGEEHPHPIVSLDHELTLSPGPRFRERYGAGAVRLDKVGEATYRLNISQVEASDQGRVYCQAREWIQDPDRSWYPMTQKDSETTTLKVKAKDEVEDDQGSLVVTVSVKQGALQEGQELTITCGVDGLAVGQLFSVAWLRNGLELARFSPIGVLQVGAQYGSRQSGGEMMATKTTARDHQLVLRPVRVQDQGGYLCRAWPQDSGPDGSFTQGQARDSRTQMVHISATASGLSVQMETESVVTEGGTLQLTCNVTGFRGGLSVTWEYKSGPTAASPSRLVAGLSHEGVMEPGPDFAQRDVKATRPAADVFTLELSEVRPADAGAFQCTVSEWTVKPTGDVDKSHSQAQMCTVHVSLLETSLKLGLMGRDTQATLGGDVALMCQVKGPIVPMTLTWTLLRDGLPSFDKLVEQSPDGVITWQGDWQQRYQLRVERTGKTSLLHTLRIVGATLNEAGRYQCEVSVFLEKRHKKMPPSNNVAVRVSLPKSKLSLTSDSRVRRTLNEDVTLRCQVEGTTPGTDPGTTPGTVRYAVTWQKEETNHTLLVSDRDGVVTPGAQATPDDERRISMVRRAGPRFELTIRQARIGDSGRYLCVVVEWLQDPNHNWFHLAPAHTAMTVEITEPANDLQVDKEERRLVVTEGDDVDLNCTLTSGASEPPLAYPLTWFYAAPRPGKNFTLAEVSLGGLLKRPGHPELGGGSGRRLSLSRPAHSTFQLSIRSAQQGDSGAYWCQVEQYQLDQRGLWQQKAVDASGQIHLTVKALEGNLSIGRGLLNLTVGLSRSFSVPCNVTARSSLTSAFNVTWFWRKGTGEEHRAIFTAHPDGTLQGMREKRGRLLFHHPLPGLFSLTVSGATPQDSGLYHCQVEEWLLSPSRRKVGRVERSEEIGVDVRADLPGNTDAVSDSGCSSSVLKGVLTGLIVLLLVVVGVLVLVLVLKIRQAPSPGAKKGPSLWTEGHSLKNILPETEGEEERGVERTE
ncbi:unnamed protein product [Lota lota]